MCFEKIFVVSSLPYIKIALWWQCQLKVLDSIASAYNFKMFSSVVWPSSIILCKSTVWICFSVCIDMFHYSNFFRLTISFSRTENLTLDQLWENRWFSVVIKLVFKLNIFIFKDRKLSYDETGNWVSIAMKLVLKVMINLNVNLTHTMDIFSKATCYVIKSFKWIPAIM